MGKLLQIRVSAWTYREEDVVRAWPALTALAWPRPQYPDEKRGVLELVTALENGLSFEDWPQAVAEGLREGIGRAAAVKKDLEEALFQLGTAQGQRVERNAGRGTCHIERTGAQAREGVLQGVTMLNKVMIIGRLGRDPELRYSQSGSPVCTLNIATDESYTDRDGNRVDRAEWHRVVVFQKAAENCSQYLTKGSLVFVEGSLQTRKWQDQQGQDRYTTEIKAQRVQFLDKRGGEQGGMPSGAGGSEGGYSAPRRPAAAQPGGGSRPQQRPQQRQDDYEDLGPAFPSEASGMDDVPF